MTKTKKQTLEERIARINSQGGATFTPPRKERKNSASKGKK